MNAKTFNRDLWFENQTDREFYVEDIKLKIHFYNGSLTLMDITNALKTGLTCERYSINWNTNEHLEGIKILDSFAWDTRKLFDFVKSLPWQPANYGIEPIFYSWFDNGDVTIYKGSEKSIRVFSPYALSELKPLKESPKKWTVRHAVRAIINHQYDWLRCEGVYTDDYAYDAAYDFQRGDLDNVSFAERLIERPSGWWTSERDGIVSICCHHFDSNEFKFKIA